MSDWTIVYLENGIALSINDLKSFDAPASYACADGGPIAMHRAEILSSYK